MPRSVLTFLLVHYFSIQCLCLGKVLVFAGNSFALATSFQSPILSSLTRGEQFYWIDLTSESLVTLSLPSLLQFSTARTKNLDTMATLTTQYWHRRVLAMTGQRLNSCNLSRILVMSPVRRAKGIFSMETELRSSVVKFQFSNLSSILSTEVKFNLAEWMDYVILTSIYQILDIGQNWTLLFPSRPLTSHSSVESW